MHCYSQYISRILIVFLFFGGNLRAQDNLVIKGQEEIQRMNYGKAIEYFNASFRRAPSAASSEGKANAYLGLRDYKNAARWQEKALSFEGHSESLRFRYGKTLQMLGKQRAAALQFDTCAQSMPGNEQFLGMVNFSRAAVLSEPDTAWEVTALGINSSESDFGPVIWQEGLLFSSQRNNSVLGVTFSSQANGGFLADFYYAKAKDSLRFSRPGLLPRGINTVFHEGPACLMADSSGIYFARSRRVSARSQGDVATSDLWQATFSNEKWEAPQRLPFSEQAGTYSDPFLLPDGKTLLFSAEIPGGLGGLDLYQTTLSGDQWSSPQNLGPEINTSGNERSPFVHLNGELWFASDGHPGWGGLDIFHAHPLGHRWVSPQNPGLPLNSYQDDYDLIFAANGRLGYFVSNRIHGGWDDDVFAFSFQETREIICQVQKPNTYCYTLYEENTPDPLPATLLYQWQLGDGAKYFGGTIDHCFPGPGDYQVQLEVIDSLTGELVFRQASYLLKIRNEIQAYIEAPDYIQKGVAQVFSGEESYFPGFHPEQYLWNWGDGLTSKGKVVSHTYSAPGNYEIQLLIEGDALGEGLDYYCVTRMVTVTEGPVPKPKPKATLVPPKHSPNSGMHSQNQYRIQLGVSPSGLDSLADSYRNIPGVTIVQDGEVARYLMPGVFTLREAFAKFIEAQKMGFSHLEILVFRDGKALSNQPFLNKWIPADSVDRTIVKGAVVDQSRAPQKGVLVWEDLSTGETLFKTPLDPSNGSFLQIVPKGVFYGYHVELDGHFSASQNLDLRNYKGALVIMDSISVYAISELVTEHLPVRINNLFFDFDKSKIRRESYRELFRLVRFLLEHPRMRIEIAGHTDDVGEASYNLELSQRRASAVARFLVLAGCNVDMIVPKGYGEQQPVNPGLSAKARQENRRVEFLVLTEN